MFKRSIWTTAMAISLFLGVTAFAQEKVGKRIEDEAEQSSKAAKVLREIMGTPDKEIPEDLLARAECVAVFPSVIKAGFIFGGRGGRGGASCSTRARPGAGWSARGYFNLGGGSFGLQIGAEATDFVLLFMNSEGLDSLLSNKFTLGADASVAAGPVGRAAGADTDAVMRAKILSYSRSRGLFAGLELKGVVITPDKGDMRDVYGKGVTTEVVLKENKSAAPASVREFPATLDRYSSRRVKAGK